MPTDDYPATVVEVLDDQMRFRPAALRAGEAFAESHPWVGSVEERKEKFRQLNRELSEAYGITEPELVFGRLNGSSSGSSHYISRLHRIVIVGKLSVVTYLHEFAHSRGMGEQGACRWSINLFRRCFPKQFGKLVHVGHTLIRPAEIGEMKVAR